MEPEGSFTVFTKTRLLFLSEARLIQSMSFHSISLRYSLIASYHLCTGLPSNLFLQVSRPGTCAHCSSPPELAMCLSHFFFLDLIIWREFGDEYKLWSLSLYNVLHPPLTSSLSSLNILLNTLFSDKLGLCSFHNSVSIFVAYAFGQLIFIKVLLVYKKSRQISWVLNSSWVNVYDVFTFTLFWLEWTDEKCYFYSPQPNETELATVIFTA